MNKPIFIEGGKRIGGLLEEAVRNGGCSIAPFEEAEGLIFLHQNKPERLAEILAASPRLEWIQLPFAGIEPYIHLLDKKYRWTCGKGVYARPVAEMALGLMMVGLRGLNTYVRAKSWEPPKGINLIGARVVILGGGGISRELVRLLAPFNCEIQIARKHNVPLDFDASDPYSKIPYQIETIDKLPDLLTGADAVVLALSLTSETEGIIDAEKLDLMPSHSWIVNVARGGHIKTDDLVKALETNSIGGAGLDVTEPEPLPDNHPLWSLDNCVITPHVGNTPEMGVKLLTARIQENTKRFCEGTELLGPINTELGY